MRKKLLTSTLIGALIVLAVIVAVATAGCGTATQAAALPQAGPTDAQAILTQALASAGSITSGTGDFNVSVTIDADASKLPAGSEALLSKPLTVSGTFAFSDNPEAAEATLNASIAGQSIPVGLKAVDEKVWIQFMGQWYEVPADAMGTATTGTTAKEPDVAGILQALTAAGVNPTAWMTDLTVVGEESLNGTPTYHLSGTIDMNKITTDVVKLMQDKTFQGMIPSIGSGMMGTTGTSVTLPSQEELQTLQSQLGTMFKSLTLDMWITKDTYQFRQVELKATIAPPAEATESTAAQATPTTDTATNALLAGAAQGIKSISLDAKISLTPATTPVTVTPPTDAKPFSDLQQALSGLMGLFSGALGGAATGQ
jgi:hypothetical protein